MNNGVVSVNGNLSSPEQAVVSVFDRGFLFGDDIFEVCVAFQQKILGLKLHLARLRRSAAQIHLGIPWQDDELEAELSAILAQVKAAKVYLRLMITRGQGLGLEVTEGFTPNKIIMALPAKPFPETYYREGVALTLARNSSGARGAQAKTGNYLSGIVAMQKANAEGFDDILWCNSEGEITEASTANIFLVARHGNEVEVVTPYLQSGLLAGITRDYVLRILRANDISVMEQAIVSEELPRFDEAFICSTMRGVIPVQRIDGQRLATRRINSLFNRIEQHFLAAVWEEIGVRCNWNTGEPL